MTINWTPTSEALPPEGGDVEFLLDHRSLALSGIYRRGMFASRWSEYDAAAVREWRNAPGPDLVADGERQRVRLNGRF